MTGRMTSVYESITKNQPFNLDDFLRTGSKTGVGPNQRFLVHMAIASIMEVFRDSMVQRRALLTSLSTTPHTKKSRAGNWVATNLDTNNVACCPAARLSSLCFVGGAEFC